MGIAGKVALVTGAASGIGAATVERFVAEGAKVCMTDIQELLLKAYAASFPSSSVTALVGDVSDADSVRAMVDATLTLGGKIDILVNSAAIDPTGPDVAGNLAIWQKIHDVNLTGPYMTMKAAIPHMIAGGGGSIVNISSLSAIRFMAGRAAYTSAKGGLVSLSQQVAVEYGPVGIRCNVICPGAIATPLFERNMRPLAESVGKDVEWVYEKFTAFSPLRRIGRPEEVASICCFLGGDDSSLMTGGVLIADGGTNLIDANGAAISVVFPDRHKKKGGV
jgi:meso-butanediol dehydrogenase / (S,S)-butanediol dehydrogenase / diacetyl reductase